MKFSIGEFSRITALTIKSLRLYHEKGLLIPAEIDEFTNYRYYNNANIQKAFRIKLLREYDFSLSEIRELLDECENDSELLEILKNKQNEISKKITKFHKISSSIEKIITESEEEQMETKHEFAVEEKELDTILIAGHRMKGRYDEVGKGFSVIGKTFGRHIAGKPLNLYYDNEYKEEGADFEPCFPIKKGTSTEDVSVRELPGGKCVSLIHKGPYDELSRSYQKIFEYIKEKNYDIILPHREVYIKGPGLIFKGKPQNYLTEIQILVNK